MITQIVAVSRENTETNFSVTLDEVDHARYGVLIPHGECQTRHLLHALKIEVMDARDLVFAKSIIEVAFEWSEVQIRGVLAPRIRRIQIEMARGVSRFRDIHFFIYWIIQR